MKSQLWRYFRVMVFIVSIAKGTDLEQDSDTLSPETLQTLAQLLQCNDQDQQQVYRARAEYWTLDNYAMAEHGPIACHETVTFTTHADHTFLDNILPIVTNWLAPISVAVFAPGTDFEAAVDSIRYLRDCSDTSLVKEYVSFHLFFPSGHLPKKIPKSSDAFEKPFDCSISAPYMQNKTTYRAEKKLMYPVNVARNIAVETALTHFVLPADIELYPSLNLVPQFLNMIARNRPPLDNTSPRVFPLNIFDMLVEDKLPLNKDALLELYNSEKALPFQESTCRRCHYTPKREEWLETRQTPTLEVFAVSKRQGELSDWEPTFLSARYDAYFEERLFWEGMHDKKTSAYILCLLDYDFMVLNNAFLIHRPTVKTPKRSPERKKIINATNEIIVTDVVSEYSMLYGQRQGCKVFWEAEWQKKADETLMKIV